MQRQNSVAPGENLITSLSHNTQIRPTGGAATRPRCSTEELFPEGNVVSSVAIKIHRRLGHSVRGESQNGINDYGIRHAAQQHNQSERRNKWNAIVHIVPWRADVLQAPLVP